MADITIGRHRIVTGDCIEGLDALEPESVDVCVTSPPYNIGMKYGLHDDRMSLGEYARFILQMAFAVRATLKRGGSFFINVGSTSAAPWIADDVAAQIRGAFILQNRIVWVKSISIGDDTHGHFKPISSERYINQCHETIFHFTKTGWVPINRLAVGVPFKDKSNIARRGHAQDRRCAGNVWFIPYKTVQSRGEKFNHPAGFPVELPLRCIRLHGVERPVVLDPFLGAGTTLVAAERAGGSGVGFEIDPAYAATAAARLSAEISAATAVTSP